MPPQTIVTVKTPAGSSKTKSPRVPVKTRDAKTATKSAPTAASVRIKSDPPPTPQPATATASASSADKKPDYLKRSYLETLLGALGILILCFVLFFTWKGISGTSSEKIAMRIEKTVTDGNDKNRTVVSAATAELAKGFSSLEKKLDEVIQANDKDKKEFVAKTAEIEKGMISLAEGYSAIEKKVSSELTKFHQAASKSNEEFQKQTGERVDSLAKRIEDRLERNIVPPPLPQNPPSPPLVIQQEGTRAVTASNDKHLRFEGEELRPGEMSRKYCIDDIKAGKIEISSKSGIIARNHLHLWRSGWIDTPVPPSGTYVASPDAKFISFYSLTDTFTVKRIRM